MNDGALGNLCPRSLKQWVFRSLTPCVSLCLLNVGSRLLPWNTCAIDSYKPLSPTQLWNQLPHTLFRVMNKDMVWFCEFNLKPLTFLSTITASQEKGDSQTNCRYCVEDTVKCGSHQSKIHANICSVKNGENGEIMLKLDLKLFCSEMTLMTDPPICSSCLKTVLPQVTKPSLDVLCSHPTEQNQTNTLNLALIGKRHLMSGVIL